MLINLGVGATGVNQASGATSAGAALPNDASGNRPRFVRVASTAAVYFRFGQGGVPTAVATDILVQPGDAVVLDTSGNSHFAVLQVAAAGVVVVTPLEG